MLGSSLPGPRTTATSAREGRLKSGALSVAKRKQTLKQGLTPMVQQQKQKTVMAPKAGSPTAQISKTIKGGEQSNIAKQKSLAAKSLTSPTIPTGMGTGMVPNSAGKVASIVSKVSQRFAGAIAPKKEQKKAFTAAVKKLR